MVDKKEVLASAFAAHPRLQVAVPVQLQEKPVAAVASHPRLQVAVPKKFEA